MDTFDRNKIRLELLAASKQLSSRGLHHAAKWASELLISVLNAPNDEPDLPTELDGQLIDEPDNEEPFYLLAKAYFDLKEYYRASNALADCHNANLERNVKKKKVKSWEVSHLRISLCPSLTGTLAADKPTFNRELKALKDDLQQRYAHEQLDGFGLYLYGLVLKELELKEQATQLFCESVAHYPWNWSAWHALAALCQDREQLDKLPLPEHWTKYLFVAHTCLELQRNNESLAMYEQLAHVFVNSNYILAQTALANYNLKEFDSAEQLFDSLATIDPFRLTNMDVYSNILYVKEEKAKLSYLAMKAVHLDKYTPETCCIVGNYYSLRGEHAKAVTYFQRALQLNKKYLSAWTLMGHEYIELKNTSQAIKAYREAVKASGGRDFRAWYGIGQAYELLQLPLWALHYYQRAVALKPYDARMWVAVAGCHEQAATTSASAHHLDQAIKCYIRAEQCGDVEALHKLAQLYHKLGHDEQAAFYYRRHLTRCDQDRIEDQTTIDALLFLAQFCKNSNRVSDALVYCNRLMDYSGKEQDEAKALMRDIHSSQQYSASALDTSAGLDTHSP